MQASAIVPPAPVFLRHPVDAARLRQLRSDAGLSQEILAYRARVCLRTVRLAERGIASRRTVEAIAGVLHVPADELLVAAGQHLPPPPPQQEASR